MEFNNLKELGAYLKAEREKKGISREEVAFSIKISNRILQALEEGDESKLPTKTYLRGFIQNYAKYLGLNLTEVMDGFQKLAGTTKPQPPLAMPETKNVERRPPSDIKRLLTITAILASIIVIILLERALRQRELDQESPVQVVTGASSPLNISRPSSTPDTNAGSPAPSPMASPETQISPITGSVAANVPLQTPVLTLVPSPTATPAPTTAPRSTPTPAPAQPTPTPQAALPPEPAGGPQEIIVEALDTVALKVSIDGEPQKTVNLNIDQIQTFRAKDHIRIVISNGGAVNVIHNGIDLGVPGNLGQSKTLAFPR